MEKVLGEHETCGRCGRKLKTEVSRREGFGPVCKRKWDAAKEIFGNVGDQEETPPARFKMDAAGNLVRS